MSPRHLDKVGVPLSGERIPGTRFSRPDEGLSGRGIGIDMLKMRLTTSWWASSGRCVCSKPIEYSVGEESRNANTPIVCVRKRTSADRFEIERVPVGCHAREGEDRRKHRLSDVCVRPKYVMYSQVPIGYHLNGSAAASTLIPGEL